MSWKISLLVTFQILGLFANTFTAGNKYFFRTWENLPQPIEMQLSQKQKLFSPVVVQFRNSNNFLSIFCWISEMYITFLIFPKLRWSSWLMYFLNYELPKRWLDKCFWKTAFKTPFESQHGKGCQKVLKSVRQPFFGILYHCKGN